MFNFARNLSKTFKRLFVSTEQNKKKPKIWHIKRAPCSGLSLFEHTSFRDIFF